MLQKYTFMIVGLLMNSMLYGQKVEVTPIGEPDKVVYDIQFNKSGSRLATTDGPSIKIWDVEQKQLVQTLSGHGATILAIDYIEDDLLASGSQDGQLVIWDASQGSIRARIAAHTGAVNDVDISSDGSMVATAGADGQVKVWRIATSGMVATLSGHTADATTAKFDKTGEYLISGSADHTLKVWSLKDASLYKTLKGHKNWVRSVAVSPDGQHIASSSDDRRVLVWKLHGRNETTPVEKFRKLHKNWITSLDYQEEGDYFVSTGHDNNLTTSHSGSPKNGYYVKYKNPLLHHAGHQYAWKAVFQPNSYRIAIATLGKGVFLTDYFQKIFQIPHELKITEINNQEFSGLQLEFSVQSPLVKIKGEVSRPKMVAKMVVRNGEETFDVKVKRNGKFFVTLNLQENDCKINFEITDKDHQINNSAHYFTIRHQ